MSEKKKDDLTSEIISEIDRDDSYSSDSEESSKKEKSIDQVKVSKEFQENVIKFVKLDDLMRKKSQELAELREQRKPIEQYILKYLDNVDVNVIDITDGKLRKNKSETKAAINQDIMKNAMTEKIKDPKIVEEILKLMEDKRQMNTHVNLKRTGTRPNRKKVDKKKQSGNNKE
jgi:hypothetical protein